MRDRNTFYKGAALMLLSSALACTGQLVWKLSARDTSVLLMLLGLALYGGGALLMIIALRSLSFIPAIFRACRSPVIDLPLSRG